MNQDKWRKAKELFHEAQALPLDERVAFLDKACAEDFELREQVENLLSSYESGFMEEPVLNNVIEAVGAGNEFNEGQVIGRYRLNELIGTGGMGEVFLSDDTELNRPVAFKVLHSDVADDDERVRRFIQEARSASALNHPNILTIHEIGSFEGSRFIVSEYVDGETLRERMAGGLTAVESLEITCQIAAALQAAHQAGIVHRDIQPENIMLRKDGLVKVLDFGLAKLTEADDRPIDANVPTLSRLQTSPGLIMGTVAYMSPEQASGQVVDARTDLWSLGVVFHEMLTGESPFKGESVTDLVTSILKHDPASLDLTEISQELQPICKKALAKDQKARYQTAQDLLKDLQGEKKRMEYAIQPNSFVTVSTNDELKTQLIRPRPTLSAEYIVHSVKQHKVMSASIFALIVLAIGAGTSMSWFNLPNLDTAAVIDPNNLSVLRLTTTGRERWATISPDGKSLAHLVIMPDGKSSLMVRSIDKDDDRVLVSGDFQSRAPVFSPDGKYIYNIKILGTKRLLSRISASGGEEFQISDNFRFSNFDISPDGDHIVYPWRKQNGDPPQLNMSSINAMISKTDQPVSLTPKGETLRFIGGSDGPAFSPDGKKVSIPIEEENTRKRKIAIYDISGKPPQIINAEFAGVAHAVWLSNKDLLVSAKRADTDSTTQLWQLGLDGSLKQLTFDLTNYSRVSISADRSTVVATESSTESNLYVASTTAAWTAEMGSIKQITRETRVEFGCLGMSWTRDSALIFSYAGLGGAQLRIIDSNGGNSRLFTPGQIRAPESPVVTPDGKYLLFNAFNEKDEMYLYRYDLGSKSLLPLAYAGPWPWFHGFSITPDSKSVIYTFVDPNWKNVPQAQQTGGLRKISIDGGEPTDIRVDNSFPMPQVSPDGKSIGLMTWDGRIGIVPMGDPKAQPRYLDVTTAFPNLNARFFRWSSDSRAIVYITTNASQQDFFNLDSQNLRRLPVDGGPAANLTNFTDGRSIYSFAYTPDGKQLAMSRGLTTSDIVLVKNLR